MVFELEASAACQHGLPGWTKGEPCNLVSWQLSHLCCQDEKPATLAPLFPVSACHSSSHLKTSVWRWSIGQRWKGCLLLNQATLHDRTRTTCHQPLRAHSRCSDMSAGLYACAAFIEHALMSVASCCVVCSHCATAFGRSDTGNSHHWSQAGVRGCACQLGTCTSFHHLSAM